MKPIRCVVAALNSNGEPDFYFVKIRCSQIHYDAGKHYDAAMEKAEVEGYEAYLAYDEHDTAGKQMMPLFQWDTASEVMIASGEDDSEPLVAACERRAIELYYEAVSSGKTAEENLVILAQEFGEECVEQMLKNGIGNNTPT